MDKRELRFEKFMNILDTKKFLSINEMAQALGVSNMTIRRDFEVLNQRELVIMKNGILMLNGEHDSTPIRKIYNLDKETRVQNTVKSEIGRFAASLISPKDCIIIDTGSTTDTILPHLSPELHITLLCYNLNILMQAQQNPNISLAFAGGHYHPNSQMFESPEGINFIHSIRANKVFISAAGIHEHLGLTCINPYEVPTKQAILRSAVEHILVADSSKFSKVHSSYFGSLDEIDAVICDRELSEEWIKILEEREIKLYLV